MTVENEVDKGLVDEGLLRRAEEWFRSRNVVFRCPICSAQSWQAMDRLVTPLVWYEDSVGLGGVSYPTLTLVCTNCGSMQSFNAVLMGLIPRAEAKSEELVKGPTGSENV